MQLPHLATHLESAQRLFRQRQLFRRQWFTPLDAALALEARLRAHLELLADAGADEPQPRQAPEAFVGIAVRILRGEPDAYESACALLTGGGSAAEGALEALVLLPPDPPQVLFARFEAEPSLRVPLLQVFRRCGLRAPAGLLPMAELQRRDAALSAAVLDYLADQAEVGLDPFQVYYQDLLTRPAAVRALPAAVQAAALRGGLLRRDPRVPTALRRACDGAATEPDRARYLRLMALSGDPQFLPVLRRHAEVSPAAAMDLIACYGYPDLIPELLTALERADARRAAARAWRWLLGEPLPDKPRLGVVDGDGERAREDVDAAGERPGHRAGGPSLR
jgi:hypothetical protein